LIHHKQNITNIITPSDKPQESFQAGWLDRFRSETHPASCELSPISPAAHYHEPGKEHTSWQSESYGCANSSKLQFFSI